MDRFLTSGQHHDLLAIIKGFRNGAVYGAKIRFPHALVMTLLFRDGR
jgi:peroxisomal membrane protein 4